MNPSALYILILAVALLGFYLFFKAKDNRKANKHYKASASNRRAAVIEHKAGNTAAVRHHVAASAHHKAAATAVIKKNNPKAVQHSVAAVRHTRQAIRKGRKFSK